MHRKNSLLVDHYIVDASDYNRSFPCKETTYPYPIERQEMPLVRGFGCHVSWLTIRMRILLAGGCVLRIQD